MHEADPPITSDKGGYQSLPHRVNRCERGCNISPHEKARLYDIGNSTISTVNNILARVKIIISRGLVALFMITVLRCFNNDYAQLFHLTPGTTLSRQRRVLAARTGSCNVAWNGM